MANRKRDWSLLSIHGLVLVTVAGPSPRTLNEIAGAVGVGRTTIIRALRDLESAGMVQAEKVGRRNQYRIRKTVNFRHPIMRSSRIGDLVDHFGPAKS